MYKKPTDSVKIKIMTQKTPPIPPRDPNNSDQTRRIEEIEKCSPVDEDALKRSPFRKMMEETAQEMIPKQPSPFDLFSPIPNGSEEKSIAPTSGISQSMTATSGSTSLQSSSPTLSSNATPPTIDFFSFLGTEEPETQTLSTQAPTTPSLPEGQSFWQTADEPPDLPPQGASLEKETKYSLNYSNDASYSLENSSSEEKDEEEVVPQKNEAPSSSLEQKKRFSLETKEESPPLTSDEKEKVTKLKTTKKAQEKEVPISISSTVTPEEKTAQITPSSSFLQNQESLSSLKKETKEQELMVNPNPFIPNDPNQPKPSSLAKPPMIDSKEKERAGIETIKTSSKKEQAKEEEKGQENPSSKTLTPTIPSLAGFPQESLAAAQQAATQAAPFLSKESLSLYLQMIGTITAMVKPSGDSHTEVLLNSPSFANSKFFGSTISIDKFSTAPYQINIRLTGPQAAVDAFNQNLSSLSTAFQRGNFTFTVNRIEAVYKPLIQRKKRDEK